METHEIAEHLASLMHLDVDAMNVYDEVLTHVTDEVIRMNFTMFRNEHEHHATVLVAAIKELGETPPEPREDMMGKFAEMAMGLRSITGDQGALHAMRTAEHYHNSHYKDAQAWDVDPTLKETLSSFYGDEVKHLAFIEKKLSAPVGG